MVASRKLHLKACRPWLLVLLLAMTASGMAFVGMSQVLSSSLLFIRARGFQNLDRSKPARVLRVKCHASLTDIEQDQVPFLIGFIILGLLSTLYQEGKRTADGKKSPELQIMDTLGSIWAKIMRVESKGKSQLKMNLDGVDTVPLQRGESDEGAKNQLQIATETEREESNITLEKCFRDLKESTMELEVATQAELDDAVKRLESAVAAFSEALSESPTILAEVDAPVLIALAERLIRLLDVGPLGEKEKSQVLSLISVLQDIVTKLTVSFDNEDLLELLEEAGDDPELRYLYLQQSTQDASDRRKN